jgi:hypothetical protein
MDAEIILEFATDLLPGRLEQIPAVAQTHISIRPIRDIRG